MSSPHQPTDPPAAAPAPAAPAPPAKLGRSYSFHFLWTSTFASGFADRLAMLSVQVMLGYGVIRGVLAEDRLPDASIVAGINFFFFLPYVIWGPFAGWLADRLPRKWIMFVCDEVRGVVVLFAFTLLPSGAGGAVPGLYEPWVSAFGVELTHAWKVWGLMFSIGLFAATFTPARNSIIPNVVGYRVLQRANSVIIGMGIIGNLFGFVVGGPISEQALDVCIFLSALCYLLPGWMWPFLNTPIRRHERPGLKVGLGPLTPLIEVARGGRHILKHRPLIALTAAYVVFWGGSQLVMAVGGAIATAYDGGTGDVQDFAMIAGGFGLGMLAGALLLGMINSRLGSELIITTSMIGAAICLSLLVVVPIKSLGVVIAVACGLFGG
ncbi:MAG: MFS transporter, partial [Alphaproteobacteria bacterium]|nr:MFS transporter [Alphaproteobacteria bacterium]